MMDFTVIFLELKSIMLLYAQKLDIKVDHVDEFSLDTKYIRKNNKFFWLVTCLENQSINSTIAA